MRISLKKLPIKKILSISFIVVSVVAVIGHSVNVKADFNPNNIIDDYVFDNVNSMNAAQIDTFLNTFPSSCISQNRGFLAPDPTGYSPGGGYTFGNNVTAGVVIAHAAQAYGINPQVLLTTIQKEQSLVTGGGGCSTLAYAAAVGYGCPDSGTTHSYSGLNLYTLNGTTVTSVNGTCVNGAAKAGFSQQLIRGAWLLKFGQQRSYGNTGWAVISGNWNNSDDPAACYGGPMTQGNRARCSGDTPTYYDGYYSIDGSSVHIDNGPTAALYWYTPHFSGNQHFVSIFQGWFGSTTGQGFSKVISDDPNDLRQWVIYGGIKQYIPDSQTIYAWGLDNVPLTTMPAGQLGAVSTGPTLDRLMRNNTSPGALYFVDGGKRYTVHRAETLGAWNIGGMTTSYVSDALARLPSDGGSLTHAIKNPANSTLYMLDGANGSGQTVLRPYQSLGVYTAIEGEGVSVVNISADFFDRIDNAIGATLTSTKMVYNGANYQMAGGYRLGTSSTLTGLYPGTAQSVSAATINRFIATSDATYMVKSKTDPSIYLIDNGQKHHILYPDLLTAWSAPGAGYRTMDSAYVDLIPTGTAIGGYGADTGSQLYLIAGQKITVPAALDGAYRTSNNIQTVSAGLMSLFPTSTNAATSFIKGYSTPSVYMMDSSGHKRLIEYPDKLTVLAGSQPITVVSDTMINGIGAGASPQIFVSDGTTKYVIENGKKWTVSTGMQTDWGLSNPQVYSDGTLNQFTTAGALDNKLTDGTGAYFMIRGGSSYGTTDINIAGVWAINTAPVHTPRLIASFMNTFMLTRFARSNVPGDGRMFAIDNGQWYNLPGAIATNMTWGNEPVMGLNPSFAPTSITDWPGVLAKDSGGNFFVIDSGGKRFFTQPMISNQWTNFGATPAPTVSNSFLSLFPTRGPVERAIKGSGPSVYSAEGGTKRHILYPDTFNRYYAPYSPVSDTLLNAMPNGSSI